MTSEVTICIDWGRTSSLGMEACVSGKSWSSCDCDDEDVDVITRGGDNVDVKLEDKFWRFKPNLLCVELDDCNWLRGLLKRPFYK